MERDVSLLRCSKLSCYSEFNRMVQAIARNGGEGDITTIPGTRPQKGTSAEYNFYTTLILMLKQVISNRDPPTRKRELQRIYEWFCLNKPLIKSKTKPTQRKPKFSIITTTTDQAASRVPFPFSELDRPQTAPASLYQRFSSEDTRGSEKRPLSPPKRRPTFTAMYISRSLSRGMDLIGQPFDQLQLRQQKQTTVHSKSCERISSPWETIDGQSRPVDNDTFVKESTGTVINVIDFPPSDFPTHQSPSRQQRLDTAESSTVSLATVFSMAPGVAAQMILEKEMNEHYENNRKRVLSLHTAQTLRIGGDYQPNHRLVNTPTDSATLEPLHMKRYSAKADSINTSERLKQRGVDPGKSRSSEQPSPSHQGRAFKDQDASKSTQSHSAIKSGGDETNSTKQSSNLEVNQFQVTTLSSEAQEMMLDMKVVDGRTSTLSLSQVSLKLQKESLRTKRKQNNCDNAVSHLQIEGQGFSLDTAKQSPRVATTAAQREHGVNSPRSSTRVTREAKSGSLTSLLIRPVSLQHHSGRTGATSESVNQKVDWNSSEKNDDVDDTGETKDTTAPGGQKENSDANHVTEDSEEKAPPVTEESLIRPEEKELPTNSQNKRDSTQNDNIQTTEYQNTVEENLTSNSVDCDLSLVNEKPNDGGAVEERPGPIDGESASTVAITKELTETCSSLSQDIPTMSGEVPQSPIVVVKTSPAPARPHCSRPSSSAHKSRLLSPMNVVTLSFPSGNTHPVNRHTPTAEAGRKTPTIIAGFNKQRYRRLKSNPAIIK